MRKRTSLLILIFSIFLIFGQACEGGPAQPSEEKKFEPFSFAVITDLHIGYGILDYFNNGWEDNLRGSPGGDDKQAENLKCAVERIISEKDRFNIKFVAVLGDISDTAEKSEFLRAREILNKLNEVGIPYLPLMGNHDTWPYTQDISNVRERYSSIAPLAKGDEFFRDVFWGSSNSKNIKLITNLFGSSWEPDYDRVVHLKGGLLECTRYEFKEQTKDGNKYFDKDHKECISREDDFYLQNYGFTYSGITFVSLDLVPRLGEDRDLWDGNALPGAAKGAIATEHKQTIEFSRNYTKNHKSERKTVILFSHYPLGLTDMFSYVRLVPEDYTSIYNFAGHQHITEELSKFFSGTNTISFQIITEDIGDIKFTEFLGKRTEKPIRIVQVKKDKIDYSELLAEKCPISPTFTPTPSPMVCPPEGEPKFSISQEVITTDKLWVRTDPGPVSKETEIKTQPKGTSGEILEGPVCADDYVWWKVKYQDGITGWSAENWLEVKIIETVTPIVLTPTPVLETPIPSPTITVMPPLITEIKGKIAFVGEGAAPAIYTINADGTGLRILRDGIRPSWSPDGRSIAFVGWTHETIGIMNEDGSNTQWLSGGPRYYSRIAWSPDGTKVAFAGTEGQVWETKPINLWVMDINGENKVKVQTDTGVNGISWSPDSKKIAFSTSRSAVSNQIYSGGLCESNSVIYLVDLRDYSQRRLEDGCSPAWSPDGTKVAFVREGLRELYITYIDTGETVLFKTLPFKAYDIVWSPDGKWLAFGADYSGSSHSIYFLGPEGQILPLESGSWEMHPSWSAQE